ncbi:MAG: PAS domain S-box protein [Chloroflexales bacterium]|nr:PAS domain S-box protein [Chloroflexales bacterium]
MAEPTGKSKALRRGPARPRPDASESAPPAVPESEPAAMSGPDLPAEATPALSFPIVGIGASAGGLAAFEAFFSAMPSEPEPGMAFVLVQHLAPDHKSILTDLVQRYTQMQVFEVTDGMLVQPNCAYIIPPNHDLALLNGTLQLLAPSAPRGMRLPIDFFFRSLAQDQRERAICIVLSGTGSDGTLGLRAVKGEGGMAMAQDPDSTEYDGMPRSAIATGLIDHVLPPAAMPAQLVAYAAHAFGDRSRPLAAPAPKIQDTLGKICVVLRAQTGHDFSQYKTNTLVRRVERRMALHQIERADDYLQYLRHEPGEAEGLFRDLLIGVTSFFRDPEAFAILQDQVIPRLFAGKRIDQAVRVWVCGCSTGEEAYSLAILIQERLETLRQPIKVQIFATDVDGRAIDQARSGVFPASIAADISPERLARFFVQDSESSLYRIHKTIRDLLIFSEQDVIKDPPFSRLDLLCCRNLLIYLNPELQRKLIPLFHYALSPGGVLFLGTSETVGDFVTLFTPLERKWKLYLRQDDASGAAHPTLGELTPAPADGAFQPQRPRGAQRGGAPPNLRVLTEQSLLAHYGAAGVLITDRGEILHIYGRTGNYLEPASGDAGLNILPMAREGLRQELTIALRKAVVQKAPARYTGLRVRTNGAYTTVNLTVRPVALGPEGATPADLFLVILEEVPPADSPIPGSPVLSAASEPLPEPDRRVATLEQELRAKEEYLQTTLEEMETSNEELRSTNEELQSVNEELQSTNEELETSKEELQSVNEELATVNAELQNKVTDLLQVNNDMNNLLAGTGVGTLFIDFQLRIARFTPAITQVINLIQTDIGRPVGHIVSNLIGYNRLVQDVKAVMDSLIPLEAEVQTQAGAWYLMRIRPYRTLDNVIEGAVLTFVDITQRKQIEVALRRSDQKFAKAIQASPDGLVICRRDDGVILDVNPSWEGMSGHRRQELLGRSIAELGLFTLPDAWQQLLIRLAEHGVVRNEELEIPRRSGGRRWLLVSVEPLESEPEPCLLLIFHDVTERRQLEEALAQLGQAEARFLSAFQASPAAQHITRAADGQITDVNAAFLALFGYQRDEVLGRTVVELGIAHDVEEHANGLRLARENGTIPAHETTARTKAGSTFTVISSAIGLERDGQPHQLTFTLERTSTQAEIVPRRTDEQMPS